MGPKQVPPFQLIADFEVMPMNGYLAEHLNLNTIIQFNMSMVEVPELLQYSSWRTCTLLLNRESVVQC